MSIVPEAAQAQEKANIPALALLLHRVAYQCCVGRSSWLGCTLVLMVLALVSTHPLERGREVGKQ